MNKTIDFNKEGGLVPAIIQDAESYQVLMLGYMNEESYKRTLETGKITFFSRSRSELWVKGETSGNFLNHVSHAIDCDNDALLFLAKPVGPTCHRGTVSCFDEENASDKAALINPVAFLPALQSLLDERKRTMPEGSYTSKLFKKGLDKIAQKVGEEAVETVIAAKNDNEELLYEASDLLFHLMVLLTERGMRIEDLAKELQGRHKK
jgi:phosphoribosyl-ATP pyrophosphohydrolase/phosphoribosyl-AMP cyclohydrolase